MTPTTKNALEAGQGFKGTDHNIPAGDLMNATTVAPITDIRCPLGLPGCSGETHAPSDTGDAEDRGWHRAYHHVGNEWDVAVERFADGNCWKVYGRLEDDDEHLTKSKVLGFYMAWAEATRRADELNGEAL